MKITGGAVACMVLFYFLMVLVAPTFATILTIGLPALAIVGGAALYSISSFSDLLKIGKASVVNSLLNVVAPLSVASLGVGAGIGAFIGAAILPGLGAPLGAAIGAAIGFASGLLFSLCTMLGVKKYHSVKNSNKSEDEQHPLLFDNDNSSDKSASYANMSTALGAERQKDISEKDNKLTEKNFLPKNNSNIDKVVEQDQKLPSKTQTEDPSDFVGITHR